jgi:nucleotidyltransferase/DNA polymerase involved in DNA repair
VWVGGGRHGDGIVIAANRLARQSGVKTGMACFEAARLCPQSAAVRSRLYRASRVFPRS